MRMLCRYVNFREGSFSVIASKHEKTKYTPIELRHASLLGLNKNIINGKLDTPKYIHSSTCPVVFEKQAESCFGTHLEHAFEKTCRGTEFRNAVGMRFLKIPPEHSFGLQFWNAVGIHFLGEMLPWNAILERGGK